MKQKIYEHHVEIVPRFISKESLVRWYLSRNAAKLSALGFLIRYIYENGYRNILSLGAGHCVLEYLLKLSLPEEAIVVATDINPNYIDEADALFPKITSDVFDFQGDNIENLAIRTCLRFDIAVFFGSSYVLDDAAFIRLFRQLKEIGVKRVIDFQAGYSNYRNAIRALFNFRHSDGKLLGYTRSRGGLRKLYKQICPIKEFKVSPYEYVAICNLQGGK